MSDVIPDRAFVNSIYSHNLKGLIGLSGLSLDFKTKEDGDAAFAANFAIVAQWGPEARYEEKDSMLAQTMLNAIDDPASEVLSWIKLFW